VSQRTAASPDDELHGYFSNIAAARYVIRPRKGTVRLGSDADLTVVDLEAEGVIDEDELHGKNNVTPFHGRSTKGRAVATIVRGQLVMRDGELTGVRHGRVITQNRAPVAAGVA